MSNLQHSLPIVAIVGGGLAGTLAAIQLMRAVSSPVLIRVFEPDAQLGRGLAYGTPDLNHRLNGPARTFSLRPDQPLHFVEWLRKHAAGAPWLAAEGYDASFVPRWIYGDYIRSELLHALAGARRWVVFEHVRCKVLDVQDVAGRLRIDTEDGRHFKADHLVLALGVFQTCSPLASDPQLQQRGLYLTHPWQPEALAALVNKRKLLLVGSGLTMIDTVAALEAYGYQGSYQIVSRHGLTPEARRDPPVVADFIDLLTPTYTIRKLLRQIRQQVRAIQAQGGDWQSVVMAVRPHLARLWAGLDVVERTRFMRHARPYWDIFLHRAPPSSFDAWAATRAAGRLHGVAARLLRIEAGPLGQVEVMYRLRGQTQVVHAEFDAVINCVGFEYCWERTSDQPFVKNLLARGLVRPSAIALGIDAEPATLAVLDRAGQAQSRISAVGLPLRGILLEVSTIAELLRQAQLLAPRLHNHCLAVAEAGR